LKDAGGHGSNARGRFGGTQPSPPPFGKRLHPPAPAAAAHQMGIMRALSAFAKNESGEGFLGSPEDQFETLHGAVKHNPDATGRLIAEGHHTLHGAEMTAAEGAKLFLHMAHFFGMLAGIAVITGLAYGLAHVMGWQVS
jgi:hypothetical protein